MKLQSILEGLIGIKGLSNSYWYDIEKILLNNGFFIAGKGSHAKVYAHPHKKYVYKVFDNDVAYSLYIQYCLQNQNNPHIPKIIKQPLEIVKFFKHNDTQNNFTVVRVERLNNLDVKFSEFYNVKLQYNIVMYRKFGEYQIFRDHYNPSKAYRGINEYINAYPEFQFSSVFKTLNDIYDKIKFFADISPSNFMRRDDGTVVIIDPVADHESVKDTMFKSK